MDGLKRAAPLWKKQMEDEKSAMEAAKDVTQSGAAGADKPKG
jgi:molybdopterin synthase catalytic subunit